MTKVVRRSISRKPVTMVAKTAAKKNASEESPAFRNDLYRAAARAEANFRNAARDKKITERHRVEYLRLADNVKDWLDAVVDDLERIPARFQLWMFLRAMVVSGATGSGPLNLRAQVARKSGLDGGNMTGGRIAEAADAQWRREALRLAQDYQAKTGHGQNRIAQHIIEKMPGRTPQFEEVKRVVGVWQTEGKLAKVRGVKAP